MGATDGLTFEAFISQKLVPKLWAGACVLMDNCSVHLGETVRELIEAAGAKLIYLPPYSPDFSPIENCWSKLKSCLKAIGARTYPDLAKAIEEAFSEVSLDDIRAWFSHCCYCTSEGVSTQAGKFWLSRNLESRSQNLEGIWFLAPDF